MVGSTLIAAVPKRLAVGRKLASVTRKYLVQRVSRSVVKVQAKYVAIPGKIVKSTQRRWLGLVRIRHLLLVGLVEEVQAAQVATLQLIRPTQALRLEELPSVAL